jgi:hypothetical protein
MAGLYRRGVQRNAGTPMMQVQGSRGAGAAPSGAGLPRASQNDAKTSENVQKLGGLLGMIQQQKQAQEDVAPGLSAAEQTTSNINALPNPAEGVGFGAAPSMDGNWGGVQASAFGSGIPTSSGEWQYSGNQVAGVTPSTMPSMGGYALPNPAGGAMPSGPINIGQDYALAGQGANAAAMNAGKAVAEVQPQGFLDMLQNGWGAVKGFFGGGAGA